MGIKSIGMSEMSSVVLFDRLVATLNKLSEKANL